MLQPKKTSRDYPLAATPEPVTLRDELIKRNASGSSQKLMEEKRTKDKAEKAMKEYDNKQAKKSNLNKSDI